MGETHFKRQRWEYTAAWLAQLVDYNPAEQEVTGSNPILPNKGFWSAENYNEKTANILGHTTVSTQNDVLRKSAEIPYWWCVTTQILVVLWTGHAARKI